MSNTKGEEGGMLNYDCMISRKIYEIWVKLGNSERVIQVIVNKILILRFVNVKKTYI
jgi:hypothetical protein